MIVILHNIRSMHNVGSILRTADAAGIEKVYLCGITPAPIDSFGRPRTQITKVALGAEKFVEWERLGSSMPLIARLKVQGYKILAIEQSKKSTPYFNLKAKSLNSKTALVVGNEITGLPAPLLNKCDEIIEIPMFGEKESLNVAVAFGIVVFYLKLYNKKSDKMSKLNYYTLQSISLFCAISGFAIALMGTIFLFEFFAGLPDGELKILFSFQNIAVLLKIVFAVASVAMGIFAMVSALYLRSAKRRKEGLYLAFTAIGLFLVINLATSESLEALSDNWVVLSIALAMLAYLIKQKNAILRYEEQNLSDYLKAKYG